VPGSIATRPAVPPRCSSTVRRVRQTAGRVDEDVELVEPGGELGNLLGVGRVAHDPLHAQLLGRPLDGAGVPAGDDQAPFCCAVSQRVARAERDGLVRRAPGTTGRRAVAVSLTAEGHTLVERSVDAVLGREATLVSGLSDREGAFLAGALDRLIGRRAPDG
jgi:hypothetical protein